MFASFFLEFLSFDLNFPFLSWGIRMFWDEKLGKHLIVLGIFCFVQLRHQRMISTVKSTLTERGEQRHIDPSNIKIIQFLVQYITEIKNSNTIYMNGGGLLRWWLICPWDFFFVKIQLKCVCFPVIGKYTLFLKVFFFDYQNCFYHRSIELMKFTTIKLLVWNEECAFCWTKNWSNHNRWQKKRERKFDGSDGIKMQ